MKITTLIIAFLMITTSTFAQRKVRGNGKERTLERKIGEFNSVEIGKGINFQLLNNEANGKFSITSDANLLRLVDYKVEDGVLKIRQKEGFEVADNEMPFLVKVPSKSLDSIVLEDNANMEGIGIFEFEKVTIKDYSSGVLKMELSANDLTIINDASGEMILSGNSRLAHVKASGSGTIHLGDLSCFFMEIQSKSSGTIYTNVVNGLDGTHEGTGTIYYTNTKILNVDNRASGEIKPLID